MDDFIFPPFVSLIPQTALIAVMGTLFSAAAHIAVGAWFILYLEERRAQNEEDLELSSWLERSSKKLLSLALVFGVPAGLLLWFTFIVTSPLSVSYLTSNFMWVGCMFWAFLVLYVLAMLVHANTWRSASPKTHRRICLTCAVGAWICLFFINGIITFQLTPSKIREPINLFKAFFNHTSFPGLLLRTSFAVWIASLLFLFLLSFEKEGNLKKSLARRLSRQSIYAIALIPSAAVWYGFQTSKMSLENFSRISYLQGLMFSALLLFLVAISLTFFLSVLFPQLFKPLSAAVPLAFAIVAVGFCELTREDLRLPYSIRGAVYANDIDVKKCKTYQDSGFIKQARFLSLGGAPPPGDTVKGKLLFAKLCSPCHAIGGPGGLENVFSRIDEKFAFSLVRKSTFMKSPMPPFPGGDEEAALISGHILSSVDKSGPFARGRDIFAVRCGPCHDWERGYRTLRRRFRGADAKTVDDTLGDLRSITESMPEWTGTDEERKALSEWISSQAGSGAPR